MTGIERLRELIGNYRAGNECGGIECGELSCGKCMANNVLEPIADQIEREQDALVKDSPYDALPPDDREAAAWVRDHGGIDYVKSEWSSRVPYDRYERRRQRLLGHIAECETALGRRREIISELNHRACDLTRENAELRKRAMPEGYEWPTVDGKQVDFVTGYEPSLGVLEAVSIYSNGACEVMGHDGIIKDVKEIHVATHKVLDADGEEIRVGDEVWATNGHGPFEVTRIVNADRLRVICDDEKNGHLNVFPESITTVWHKGGNAHGVVESIDAGSLMRTVRYRGEDGEEYRDAAKDLTHQRPMLDADGVPIELGDDLYSVEGGIKLHVSHVDRINGKIATDAMFSLDKWADPAMYTHRAPVLAADGKPLREGETVWSVKDGTEYRVGEIRDTTDDDDDPCKIIGCSNDELHIYCAYFPPDKLTHTKPELPDSWERLEEDARKHRYDYWECWKVRCSSCPAVVDGKNPRKRYGVDDCQDAMQCDLVRRAKALAERGQ